MNNKFKIFVILVSIILSSVTNVLIWSFEYNLELILPVDKVFTFIIYFVLYKDLFISLYNVYKKDNVESNLSLVFLSISGLGLFLLLPIILWSTISEITGIRLTFFAFLVLTLGALVINLDYKEMNTKRS